MKEKTVVTNKTARKDYDIDEAFEAGMELKGTEVKSLRAANASLSDSFARIEPDGVYLYNMHISPYAFGNIANVEPKRKRRLLLHKAQIRRLIGKLTQKGFTLIPLSVYFNQRGRAKVELALAKGKRLYDRREDIKKKEATREITRAMRIRHKTS